MLVSRSKRTHRTKSLMLMGAVLVAMGIVIGCVLSRDYRKLFVSPDLLTIAARSTVENSAWQLSKMYGQQHSSTIGVTTIISRGVSDSCECELLATDCLESIRCMPHDEFASRQTSAMGIFTRQIIKETAEVKGQLKTMDYFPIGKSTQYGAVDVWKQWTEQNKLPHKYRAKEGLFSNSTNYPYCQKLSLVGKNCFFAPTNASEDFDLLEEQAVSSLELSPSLRTNIKSDLEAYQRGVMSQNATQLPALGHLMTMAHIVRILFNRRPPIFEVSQRRKVFNAEYIQEGMDTLKISVHMRRADSCGNKNEYEQEASGLDSPAQPTNIRKCYDTAVYMRAVKRAQEMLEEKYPGRPVEVYLSTDHSGPIMDEIQEQHSSLYQSMSWQVLDIDRDMFNYNGNIEFDEHDQHSNLGESAVADLWLLSHGEVFIGHLGSRFGKVGWLLATARYNRFVPFFSVDGHSYCCEIDEACGESKPHIRSMDNCMTFAHERASLPVNKDYWEVGNTLRRTIFPVPAR